MNKNIFRALLLGTGAVIAMQQAEASAVRRVRAGESFSSASVGDPRIPSKPSESYGNPLGTTLPPAIQEKLKKNEVFAKQMEELKNENKLLEEKLKKKDEKGEANSAKYDKLIQELAETPDVADRERMLRKLEAYALLKDGDASPENLLQGSHWDVFVSHLDSLTQKLNDFVDEQLDFVDNRIQTRINIDLGACKALLNGIIKIIDPLQEFERIGGMNNYVEQIFTNNLRPQGEVDKNKKEKIDSFATALESALYCVRLFAGMNDEMLEDVDNLDIISILVSIVLMVRQLIPTGDLGNLPAIKGASVISDAELVRVVDRYVP